MEFLDYSPIVQTLKAQGVFERREGALTRFELRPTPRVCAEAHCVRFGPKEAGGKNGQGSAGSNGTRFVETARDRMPSLAEAIVHRTHQSEIVLIPVGNWGGVLNLVVRELVCDESWLEVDAEASLHQKGRDPLSVGPKEAHIIRVMTAALLSNGESAEHDITIAATGSPLVIELQHPGVMIVSCASAMVAEKIVGWV